MPDKYESMVSGTSYAKYQKYIIPIILVILAIFALWIRLLPAIQLGQGDPLNITGSDDPLYNLRLIELMVQHFPSYPFGNMTPWGPLLTIISSIVVLVAGATATRSDLISVALVVGPIMAAIMIPIMYLLVRRLADWKAGLIAALFITVISGQYFFRSLYGYLDHHIAEVLFGVLFIFLYIYALQSVRKNKIDFRKWETLKMPILYSIPAGIAFILGLATMPTMILFAFIVTIFTLFRFIWDFYRHRTGEHLVIINTVVFLLAILGFFLIGQHSASLDLIFYSLAHPIAYLLVILGTIFLYVLARFLNGKKEYYYPLTILVIGIVGVVLLFVISPQLFGSMITGLTEFFVQNSGFLTIQEARSWTFVDAWGAFNYGLILMALGFAVMIYQLWKDNREEHLLILIWSVIALFATIQHVRYEYYMAANIAILGAIGVGFVFTYCWKDVKALFVKSPPPEAKEAETKPKSPLKKRKEAQKAKKPKTNYVNVILFTIVLILSALFVVTSVNMEYQVGTGGAIHMNPDWRESLEWMNAHTPDPGIDYYKEYSAENFTYPSQSYGVMSWWDYGHMITFIAKRIPNANPFQEGAGGPNSSSTFFVTQSEDTANGVLDALGTKYVITDIEMDTQKFWAMATWYNSTLGASPYQQPFLVPSQSDPNSLELATLYTPAYYQTTVSRLHNFDGSLTDAGQVYYIQYTLPEAANQPYPVITGVQQMNATAAQEAADRYNSNAPAGTRAGVYGTNVFQPAGTVPALSHYRLVHESPNNVVSGGGPDVKYVKVFEYVPGARIKGEGIIEIPLVSNTGRQFTYRQESVNGEFVVPYSTTGNPYDVKATGKYRIVGTGAEFDVSEDAVQNGLQIN
jgi:oligosaccharyl transferase (archaeosortase A-associated)